MCVCFSRYFCVCVGVRVCDKQLPAYVGVWSVSPACVCVCEF